MSNPARQITLLLFALLVSACSKGASDAAVPAGAGVERSGDPRVVALRDAIEEGRVELARSLVDAATADLGVEAHLLRARLWMLEDEAIEWGRALEQARLAAPGDPRVWATAAELHAAAGNLETAEREVQDGIQRCGRTPALERARGVLYLVVPGGAQQGLAALERAVEQDPGLPFVDRPLGQALLLVGKEHVRSGDKLVALEHVRRALEHDPEDRDAREFLGDVLMMVGEWGEALAVFEALVAEGYDNYREPLAGYYRNAGIWAMTQKQRELTVRYCARARELGMADEHLGHCRNLLLDHAAELVSRGLEELGASKTEKAIATLEEALVYDRESLEAHRFLGQAYLAREDPERAAQEWQWVVDTARAEEIDLPEPVHIMLAQAQALTGDFSASRETLDAYLTFEPTGEFVQLTRDVLAKLPEEVPEEPRVEDDEDAATGDDG
ncbi:MAG: tetratricopeptide repeat protein [bacterium]|nr:tetratricopeptide repeat protein [bacterium]